MTTDQFRAEFADFEHSLEGDIQTAINESVERFGTPAPGDELWRGQLLLVAHEVAMAERIRRNNGSLGLAIEKKVGNVSVKYSDAMIKAMGEDWYLNSPYGAKFLRWQREAGAGAAVI